ncbi:ribonucleoside-triphosphate reductase [Candidatus Pacearchaeota archaeon]|nr:ribonucleoside-triphosphate reductase [Candidatus Pacearchaeota archaeon]|tara:strand:- start:1713 stop:3716 length:2004 start_codon:yes stop_codon:yes gene_type:complete
MINNYLPTSYQEFIHLSRYSRWLPEEERRETWNETVVRYFDFFTEHLKNTYDYKISKPLREELEEAVLTTAIMPSMRCLMTAGEALNRENIAGYNCSYLAIDRVQSFDELLYILMNGTGVGFSVERQYISQLPVIAEDFNETETTISVADSKLGWARGFKELVGMLYVGQIPRWDLSKVRPAGAPLKTFGGRASGPEPLETLFNFTVNMFKNACGRKLSSIECHDIVCKIAEIVVVGGVRRSALISLSNVSDDRMRASKHGQWWIDNPQRALANISACYTEKPDIGVFMDEWKALYDSKSGERGIFNRVSAVKISEKSGRRNTEDYEFGTNPCSEIILRNREFCNLSEVVVRSTDTRESLLKKVRLATILGTFQSTLVNFKYISSTWKRNCEEERLLGVSLTGIMDCNLTNGNQYFRTNGKEVEFDGTRTDLPRLLEELREESIKTNAEFAKKIGINQSVALTCIKPSGTVSQLVDAASGIHARHNPYYIRTVRGDKKDPLTKMMKDAGFPVEDDIMNPSHTAVFSFPMKADKESIFRNDMSAIEQLELWLIYQNHWCEHKPSVTISVKEEEWLEVGAWVYKHFDVMSGVSFLPFSEHVYKQAPYQDIKKEEYEKLLSLMPKNVDWSILSEYEKTDMTTGSQELACTGGVCEVVDLVPLTGMREIGL